jgi:hypothetical protein
MTTFNVPSTLLHLWMRRTVADGIRQPAHACALGKGLLDYDFLVWIWLTACLMLFGSDSDLVGFWCWSLGRVVRGRVLLSRFGTRIDTW